MLQDKHITELFTHEAVGGLVDLAQPIDFVAVGKDKDFRWVATAVIKNPDEAKAAFAKHFKLLPGPNGALKIDGLGQPTARDDDDDDDDDRAKGPNSEEPEQDRRTCWIAPAVNAHRLVCGPNASSLELLTPYATRTLPRVSFASTVHAELRLAALKGGLDANNRRGLVGVLTALTLLRGSDPASRNLVSSFSTDLLDFGLDLQTVTFDSQLTDAKAKLTLDLAFGSTGSTVGALLAGHPERTDTTPALFWQLPEDSDFAYFHRGMDETQAATPRRLLVGLMTQALTRDGVGRDDLEALGRAAQKLFPSVPGVYASAVDADRIRTTFRAVRPNDSNPTSRMETRREAAEAILGWRVMGFDTPMAGFSDAVKEFLQAWNKPSVSKVYRGKEMPVVRTVPLPKGTTLPKESQHLEVALFPFVERPSVRPGARPVVAPKAPKPLTFHVLIVPEGSHTWVSVAMDEATALRRAWGALASSGDTGKLRGRQGLEILQTERSGAGGFFTWRGYPSPSQQLSVLFGKEFYGISEHYDTVAALPNHGTVPAPFVIAAQGSDGKRASMTLEFPRGLAEDLVTTAIRRGRW
jgi:hypothetical protein